MTTTPKINRAMGMMVLTALVAVAAQCPRANADEAQAPAAQGPESFVWIFAGAEAGPMQVSTGVPPESTQNGYHLRPKVMASYYLDENWVFDAGFGWARFSVDTVDKMTTVATRAGFFEFSPKWRASDRWQLGAVVDVYFGTDLTFATSYHSPSSELFLGAQAQYDLAVAESWRMRVGAVFLTDATVTDRQAYVGMAGLQIGLPVHYWKW